MPAPIENTMRRFAMTYRPRRGPGVALAATMRALFLHGGSVSGSGVSGDLGVMTAAALRTSLLAPPTGVHARDLASRAAQALKQRHAFLIGPRGTTLTTDHNSNVMLSPGRGAELGDRRLPFVRVLVVAPADKPLDLDALVAARPNGIFNALFLPPVPASSIRQQGESGTAMAAIGVPGGAPALPGLPSLQLAAPEPVVIELRVATLADAPKERALMAELAPVEDRAAAAVVREPAPAEDRVIVVWAAPVEDRVIVVWAAPVEDRVAALVLRPEVPVEERLAVAILRDPAPVEERLGLQLALPSAPGSDGKQVAMLGEVAPENSRAGAEAVFTRVAYAASPPSRPDVAQVQQSLLKQPSPMSGEKARVTQPALEKVAATSSTATPEQPVRLAAIQRRMPRILIDYRGGVFHM